MIIGIGGVSRAGKTTFAEQLKEEYINQNLTVNILSQDDFVIPEHAIPKIRDRIDWELPMTIDLTRLLKAIHQNTSDILIIEGLFAFAFPELNQLYKKKYFLKIDKSTFLYRKSIDNRYNEPQWFIEHIWDSYLKYGRIDETDNSFVILSTN